MYSSNKIEDFKESFDLKKYVLENFETVWSGSKLYISCPFHAESTPSCLVQSDRFYCYGCHSRGDSIDFLSKYLGITLSEVITGNNFSEYQGRKKSDVSHTDEIKRTINPNVIDKYHSLLLKNDDKIKYLHSRNIDLGTIKHAHIGWGYPIGFKYFNLPRYFIPVYDQNNNLVNVRCRIDPDYDNHLEPKYVGYPGIQNYLYNSSILSKHDNILVVGSEFDAAFLYHRYGIASVAPPGENIFKNSWAKMFAGKDVLLWLDSDMAGKMGMLYAYEKLKPYANKVKLYRWPLNMPNGYDIGDYVKDNGINSLVNELVRYELE